MTRRIRFTPLLAGGAFLLACLAGAPGARAADVPFAARPALPAPPVWAQAVAHVDLDRDGDLDVVSGGADVVAWHRNDGAGTAWTAGTVGTFAGPLLSVLPADVDGDGDPDVVVAFPRIGAEWFENVDGLGASWTRHTLVGPPGLDSVALADVDRDGDTDLAAHSNGGARWYANDGAGGGWTPHTIGPGSNSGALILADLDGDGDQDAVTVASGGSQLVWYENTAGTGLAWVLRNIVTVSPLPTTAATADIDGDGDSDIGLQTTYGVFWFENRLPAPWTQRTVWTASMPVGLVLGDVDGDGDVDAVTPSGTQGIARWHENVAGNGTTWSTRGVAGGPTQGVAVALGDLDGDGDADVSAGTNVGVRWFANETIHASACFEPRTTLATGITHLWDLFPADLDGDGDPDLVTNSELGILWHRNDQGSSAAWPSLTVSGFGRTDGAADVDGDGDLDLPSNENELQVYDNAAGDGSSWVPRPVSTDVEAPGRHASADLDGDGDLDFFSNASDHETLAWFENTDGAGASWTRHLIATLNFGMRLIPSDLDGDGDVDVLFSVFDGNHVLGWFENGGAAASWTRRTITTASPYAAALAVADVDGDGDPDALVASGLAPAGALVWWENSGHAASWVAQAPLPISGYVGQAGVADADHDGDLDLIVSNPLADVVRWLENTSGDGSAWTAHTIATDVDQPVAVAADLDRDGDVDLAIGSYGEAAITRIPNAPGQFSLAAENIAFDAVPDGALVPMMRLTVRHLGRAGDADLRLSSLGVRFEEFPHVPIPTAAMNALVSSLRVYRDSNDNDVFDPASDALLANVAPLVLDDGTQDVALPGLPDTTIAFGAPKDYFVVVQMTPNASHQDLFRFHVTLLGLGPQASRVEQGTTGIRMAAACAANLTSGYIRAVSGVPANVSGTKALATPGSIGEGGEVVYTFVLTNAGPGVQHDNFGIEMFDPPPPGIIFTGADATIGGAYVFADGLHWDGRLLPGQSTTITARARVRLGTAGVPVVNQGFIAHDTDGNGTNEPGPPTDDPGLPGAADPTVFTPVAGTRESQLLHGMSMDGDFSPQGGVRDNDLYRFVPDNRASYEVVVDATSGRVGPGGAPRLERLRPDAATFMQSAVPVGTGAARSLRFENIDPDSFHITGFVRVESAGCANDCNAADRYRVRAYETTLAATRFNNDNGQVTLLIIQNATDAPVAGHVFCWGGSGEAAGSTPFTLAPRGSRVINLAGVALQTHGSITVTHDAPYGGLAGKAVGIDSLVGATFDTPLVPRRR